MRAPGKRLGEPGLAGIAGRDGGKPPGPRMRQRVGEGLGDGAGADDAPAERHGSDMGSARLSGEGGGMTDAY